MDDTHTPAPGASGTTASLVSSSSPVPASGSRSVARRSVNAFIAPSSDAADGASAATCACTGTAARTTATHHQTGLNTEPRRVASTHHRCTPPRPAW